MARIVIGHGLDEGPIPDDLPYIPDRIILQEGERFWSVERGGEVDIGRAGFDHLVKTGSIVPLSSHILWKDEMWVAVEEEGLSFFDKDKEEEWKVSRAQEVLKQAETLEGEPERTFSLLRASSALVGIPLTSLIRYLEQERKNPNENLTDIYRRVKK